MIVIIALLVGIICHFIYRTREKNDKTSSKNNSATKVLKIFTRVWFGVVFVIFIFWFFGGFSSDTDNTNEFENASEFSKVTTISLKQGETKIGKKLPVGRYKLTGSGSGVVTVDGVHYSLGPEKSQTFDVTYKDTKIVKNPTIKKITFTPIKHRTFQTTLTPGAWVVGKDIRAGTYKITTTDSNGANITTTANDIVTLVSVDDSEATGEKSAILTFENGETVVTSTANAVNLEPK